MKYLLALIALLVPGIAHADENGRIDTIDHPAAMTGIKPAVRMDPPEPPPAIVGGLGDVDGWHDVAIASGWSEAMWPWVRCVIRGESNGDPNALNINARTGDYSLGLMQLNTRGSLWGWYKDHGLVDRAQLFDPYMNLHMAHVLFYEMKAAGLYPWGRHRCGLR